MRKWNNSKWFTFTIGQTWHIQSIMHFFRNVLLGETKRKIMLSRLYCHFLSGSGWSSGRSDHCQSGVYKPSHRGKLATVIAIACYRTLFLIMNFKVWHYLFKTVIWLISWTIFFLIIFHNFLKTILKKILHLDFDCFRGDRPELDSHGWLLRRCVD